MPSHQTRGNRIVSRWHPSIGSAARARSAASKSRSYNAALSQSSAMFLASRESLAMIAWIIETSGRASACQWSSICAHSSHRCVFWNKRDRAVQGTLGISVTAQTLIAPGDLFEKGRVLWIKLDSALKIFGRFGPSPLTSINIAEYLKLRRIIRQTLLCQG